MWLETDDEAAIAFRAESALVTRKAFDALRWADNYAIAFWCRETVRAVLRYDGGNG